jgi:hypothetical protein
MGEERASDWHLLEWDAAEKDERDPLKVWLLARENKRPFLVHGDWILEVTLDIYDAPDWGTNLPGARCFTAMAVGYLDERLKTAFEDGGLVAKLRKEAGPDFDGLTYQLPIFNQSGQTAESRTHLHVQAHHEIDLRQLKKLLAKAAAILDGEEPAEAPVN